MGLRTRFDAQAAGFDERAGLGADVACQVGAAILAHPHDAVLELGPGTGELGEHLAAAGGRYVGLDSSAPMLAAFAARRPPTTALLVLADAARPWPVRGTSIDLLVASRAAHLLDPHHLGSEVMRVGRSGATFLCGRVDRPAGGLRARLRARRRDLLAEHGLGGGDGRSRERGVFDAFVADGAELLPRHGATTWTAVTDADEVIAHWAAVGVRGGRPIPPDVAAAVLQRLRDEYAGQSEQETETYILEGVRLP